MANPDGTLTFWHEGVTTTAITTAASASIGTTDYWHKGNPEGFLYGPYVLDPPLTVKARNFAVLINF